MESIVVKGGDGTTSTGLCVRGGVSRADAVSVKVDAARSTVRGRRRPPGGDTEEGVQRSVCVSANRATRP